jgi:hypothetical protein
MGCRHGIEDVALAPVRAYRHQEAQWLFHPEGGSKLAASTGRRDVRATLLPINRICDDGGLIFRLIVKQAWDLRSGDDRFSEDSSCAFSADAPAPIACRSRGRLHYGRFRGCGGVR